MQQPRIETDGPQSARKFNVFFFSFKKKKKKNNNSNNNNKENTGRKDEV